MLSNEHIKDTKNLWREQCVIESLCGDNKTKPNCPEDSKILKSRDVHMVKDSC